MGAKFRRRFITTRREGGPGRWEKPERGEADRKLTDNEDKVSPINENTLLVGQKREATFRKVASNRFHKSLPRIYNPLFNLTELGVSESDVEIVALGV